MSKDHVHILVSAPPNIAPNEIMRRVKGRCSSKLFDEFPHIKKRYWGRHFWARGYFCATVGQMTEDMIKEYLQHHFEPRKMMDLRLSQTKTRCLVDAYACLSGHNTNPPAHQLLAGGC